MEHARALAELHRTQAILPTPLCTKELQARLEDAGKAMLGLAVRNLRPAEMRSAMPEYVRDACEAYGWTEEDMPYPVPSAKRISQMDLAYSWVDRIPLDPPKAGSGMLASPHGGAVLRRIVIARSFVNPHTGRHIFSERRIAKLLHCSHKTIAAWHARGLDMILASLWRQGHNGGPTWIDASPKTPAARCTTSNSAPWPASTPSAGRPPARRAGTATGHRI